MADHGSYIVMFKNTAPQDEIEKAKKDVTAQGGKIGHIYDTAFKGFSATLPDNTLTAFTTNPHIENIEADGQVTALAKSKGIGA
ncbi:hypothetical protein DFS34DRAFT_622090 [Phlyctochytrium arcticum]|nr:hypothetical protein DFS34DRAFT_622090 [Phlyctochytrium arcticum]